jgi:hypothetical protein
MPPVSQLEASRERSRWVVSLVVYGLVALLLWSVRTT